MGVMLFSINPFFAFIQRFIPRVLDGFLIGVIFNALKQKTNPYIASTITGFLSAFFNTAFFMSALVLLFGNTEYMQEIIAGKNIIVFICTFVGINAVVEMLTSTIVTGAVGSALYKAKLIPSTSGKKREKVNEPAVQAE